MPVFPEDNHCWLHISQSQEIMSQVDWDNVTRFFQVQNREHWNIERSRGKIGVLHLVGDSMCHWFITFSFRFFLLHKLLSNSCNWQPNQHNSALLPCAGLLGLSLMRVLALMYIRGLLFSVQTFGYHLTVLCGITHRFRPRGVDREHRSSFRSTLAPPQKGENRRPGENLFSVKQQADSWCDPNVVAPAVCTLRCVAVSR